jgi:hypothetical protein
MRGYDINNDALRAFFSPFLLGIQKAITITAGGKWFSISIKVKNFYSEPQKIFLFLLYSI